MQHLSLEQCQQLKSIGFPQDAEFRLMWNGESGPESEHLLVFNNEVPNPRWRYNPSVDYACPTLEELLEWTKLENLWKRGDEWVADTMSPFAHVGNITASKTITTRGKDPLEATYNLAISLYGK